MRFDSFGLFWNDPPRSNRGAKQTIRPMPPIPETGWLPPSEFPNLSCAACISIDCETYDPELLDNGPGWARGCGHIVGVSIGVPDGRSWYFPVRHEVEPEYNLDPIHVFAWLRDTLCDPSQPKVGANLQYDIGWLRTEGVLVRGELVDVQFAEALLDESADVNLEELSQKYLGEGKESNILYDWCAKFYGGKAKGSQRANIYRSPPRLVGPYAESDAYLPLRLAEVFYPLLVREHLLDLFQMENSLIPLLVDMRFKGVRVDVEGAERLGETLGVRIKEEHAKLKNIVGYEVDINSGPSLAKAFEKIGVGYARTAKGKASFTKQFLEQVKHPIGNTIREIRKLEKLKSTFIESYILTSHVKGRIHCSFHQLRSDDTGTRSGRFSSSAPNLQNIPSRDDELAPLVRGLFIPDEGHRTWRKYDYSQIEYRMLIHFACGRGSDEARLHFNEHPETDYHEWALDLVAPKAGWEIETKEQRKHWRKPVKNINFGLIYGMGIPHLCEVIGIPLKEGKNLFAAYHDAVPFAKATMQQYSKIASDIGTTTTILGRKSRFDLWEPAKWDDYSIPLPYNDAVLHYGNIRRAMTHKALNRLLQGSAADMMKAAMAKCYADGVFDITGVPEVTVHDELDFSDNGHSAEAFREMKHIMESVLSVKIPIKADCDIGADWGHLTQLEE